VPQRCTELVVDSDLCIAAGYLEEHSGDLVRLIGRPTTPLAETVAAGLKNG